MNEYVYDIFYKVHHLSIKTKLRILRDVYSVCYDWHIDAIPSGSVQRKRIGWKDCGMQFEEIISRLDDDSHMVFIHRRGYPHDPDTIWVWRLECGFRGSSQHDIFLFMDADQEHIERLVKKYKLIPL